MEREHMRKGEGPREGGKREEEEEEEREREREVKEREREGGEEGWWTERETAEAE